MKEYLPNIITLTDAEVRRIFTNAKGMARSDKRLPKPELRPTPPSHEELKK